MFPHHNTYKFTWTSPGAKTKNKTGHILLEKKWTKSVPDIRLFWEANCDTDHYLVAEKLGRDWQ
jgi:hypothetical protein